MITQIFGKNTKSGSKILHPAKNNHLAEFNVF